MVITCYDDVILRSFDKDDVETKVNWINNPDNNRFLHYELPLKVDKTLKWFKEKDNTKRIDCIIVYNGIAVGVIGLLSIDKINSKAEYYITIGETSFKNKGIATKATQAIIEYGFKELGLHKIYLTVDADNEAAIRLYEKTGFIREGVFVDDMYNTKKSRFINRARYAIFRQEE